MKFSPYLTTCFIIYFNRFLDRQIMISIFHPYLVFIPSNCLSKNHLHYFNIHLDGNYNSVYLENSRSVHQFINSNPLLDVLNYHFSRNSILLCFIRTHFSFNFFILWISHKVKFQN